MTDNNNAVQTTSGGVGFSGLLTIAFVVLKLTGVIAWKWIWVFAPLWISASIGFVILFFILMFILLLNK